MLSFNHPSQESHKDLAQTHRTERSPQLAGGTLISRESLQARLFQIVLFPPDLGRQSTGIFVTSQFANAVSPLPKVGAVMAREWREVGSPLQLEPHARFLEEKHWSGHSSALHCLILNILTRIGLSPDCVGVFDRSFLRLRVLESRLVLYNFVAPTSPTSCQCDGVPKISSLGKCFVKVGTGC